MKRTGLKIKLISFSLATIIIPMVISIGAAVFIITRQNQTASNDQLQKAMNIVRDDLLAKQAKLLSDAVQLATMNQMGSRVKFIFEYKKDITGVSMTKTAQTDMNKDLFQIGRASNLWQTAIYDPEGDLLTFATQGDEGAYVTGYRQLGEGGQPVLHAATVKVGQELSVQNLQRAENIQERLINAKLGQDVPKNKMALLESGEGFIIITAYAPVTCQKYNPNTNQPEQYPCGVAVAKQRIDKVFLAKMSALTGMKLNVFSTKGLSVGDLPEYDQRPEYQIAEAAGQWNLAKQEIVMGDVDIAGESYFQAILPLGGPSGSVGSIAALYSKRVAKANAIQMILLLAIIYLVCTIVIVPFAIMFANRLVKPIHECVAFAENIGEGDFSQRMNVDTQDEVGALSRAFNKMADSLSQKTDLAAAIASGDLSREVNLSSNKDKLGGVLQEMTLSLNDILSQINKSVTLTAAEAKQVSDASQVLSRGASEQAASLQQITGSIQELASRTKTNAEHAAQANQLAAQAQAAAENGNLQMGEMTKAMEGINKAGKKIAEIIKAIDDIAGQTNLLALNAALEAARAGQHGKGFAVVAQEVRNLASLSAKAAQDTSELIEDSVKRVENGSTILAKTAEALAGIVEGASKAADLVDEIAAASDEQAQRIAQINQGLNQIKQVAQATRGTAGETASVSEKLSNQATHLRGIVARFKLQGQND